MISFRCYYKSSKFGDGNFISIDSFHFAKHNIPFSKSKKSNFSKCKFEGPKNYLTPKIKNSKKLVKYYCLNRFKKTPKIINSIQFKNPSMSLL